VVASRRARAPKFVPHLISCLDHCWLLTADPGCKRVAPMIAGGGVGGPSDGEIVLSDADAALLVSTSPASTGPRVRPPGVPRGCSHTKPGTLLTCQIPVHTWAEWSEDAPGFVEIELVGHKGGNSTDE
jgi:hypothetical protein